MKIIGCDYHPSYQQIAMVDTETGEMLEGRLEHEQGEARRFYEALPGQKVRVGIEAIGNSQWFERMLSQQGHELWIGDAAQIRRLVVRQQKTDRRDAKHILDLLLDGRFPKLWVPSQRDARCAAVVAAPAEAGGDTHAGEEPVAASGAEPGRAAEAAVVEQARPRSVGAIADGRMDGAASKDLLAMLDRLEAQVGELDQAVRAEAERRPEVRLLMTHPGVGPVVGLAYVLTIGPTPISSRQARGQLPGTDSARAFFGRASETGSDQQAREHDDAHAVGGGGANGFAVRSRVAARLRPAESEETFGVGESDGGAQAGGEDVLDAAGEQSPYPLRPVARMQSSPSHSVVAG